MIRNNREMDIARETRRTRSDLEDAEPQKKKKKKSVSSPTINPQMAVLHVLDSEKDESKVYSLPPKNNQKHVLHSARDSSARTEEIGPSRAVGTRHARQYMCRAKCVWMKCVWMGVHTRVSRLGDLAAFQNLVEGVDTLSISVESVHEMHGRRRWVDVMRN